MRTLKIMFIFMIAMSLSSLSEYRIIKASVGQSAGFHYTQENGRVVAGSVGQLAVGEHKDIGNDGSDVDNLYVGYWMPDGLYSFYKGIEIDADNSKGFSLSNYPNPFRASTTIKFILDSYSYVSVKIYNINGQEVASLGGAYMSEGMQEFVWDGNQSDGIRASTGSYLYELQVRPFGGAGSGDEIRVRNIMVVNK
jgi:FlgD Ig-like domain